MQHPKCTKKSLQVNKLVYLLSQIFPPSWHLLHLHLDIHWLVLEILHVLSEKMMSKYAGLFFLKLVYVVISIFCLNSSRIIYYFQ